MPALTKASNSAKALKSDCCEVIFHTKLEANAAKDAQGGTQEAQDRDKGVVHLSHQGGYGMKKKSKSVKDRLKQM